MSSLSVAMLSHLASRQSPTGAERSLALLATGLRRRGNRVTLVAPGPWALTPELDAAGVEVRTQPCRVLWMTSYQRITAARAVANSVRYGLPASGERELEKLLVEIRPDVVHVNCLPHVRGARAAGRAGFPVVWHLREILPPGRRRRWFADRLRHGAREIVAVSEAVAQWLRDEGLGDRVTVIHNGVEVDRPVRHDPGKARAELGLPADGCVVGLFGQILPHKGVLEFVRAGRRALSTAPGLRLAIAGHGPAEFVDRVRREIASGAGSDRIHLLAPQPTSDRLLAAADAVCLTTTVPDPLPRAVLEAMAAARPVVAFRSGGAPEMVEDERTGFIVEVGDERALASRLERLAADPGLRARLGRAGRDRARERFSIEHHVRRMEQLLSRAAESP